ncbi:MULTISPECIES: 4,5-dihydroxyphthalate decarboxylase [Haloferax]|uniref:4,5-dihydroxyphthalate decarboxylase n=1 Tax=Haloferax marinum TaxID=2666143 RepID=A0A6A8G6A7_9EURY|nr:MULTISPECIES: 4,5-dihydroxyphthalate decarboxylase [Haloferax]KAB1197135.1 4,5-dihydroxyphthalate decarboxylase [Haloferax sp. CBA1150]MRW96168.1 4,5-dihydroxyphthalate decarboxylase [Haloferax marinum]
MTVDLTLACTEYDWTRPLWDGVVEPEGTNLHVVDYHNPERFERMVRHGEFDACELSLGSYLSSVAADREYPFTAIPVFPYRKFRHSFIFRRTDDDFGLADLEGKDVGLVHWQTTTGIWQRGTVAEHYGVDLASVTWHTVKPESDIVPVDIPNRFDVVRHDRSGRASAALGELLVEGELDAVFVPTPIHRPLTGGDSDRRAQDGPSFDHTKIERVLDDSQAVEEGYYRETGIFPPMHTVVVSDDLLERYPWVANKLYEAFEESLEQCLGRLSKPRWFPLAWANQHVERQHDIMGENPWEYGLTDENRRALSTLQSYAVDHGIVSEPRDLEDLFVESTL